MVIMSNAKIAMPDTIGQVVVKNYKAKINVTGNAATINYASEKEACGTDFVIVVQMREPFAPKTSLEIMEKE
jgi:hypothetical protein